MVHIYILIDPETNEIRYCGKTSQSLQKRLGQRYSGHTKNWIQSLKAKGLKPTQVEIDYVEDEDWQEAEILYIAHLRTFGCILTNHTIGGDGHNGHSPSEETRAKKSEALKGKPWSEARRAALTEEVRAKMSVSHIGKIPANKGKPSPLKGKAGHPQSEETRRKISEVQIGRKASEETRAKMASARLGKKMSPMSAQGRANISVSLKGKPGHSQSEEARAKISASRKGKSSWNRGISCNEETRAKISATKMKGKK